MSRSRLSASLLCMLFLASCLFAARPTAAGLELRLGIDTSATSSVLEGLQLFAQEAEQAAGGGLTVTLHSGEEAYSGTALVQAVSSGTIEMGLLPLEHFEEPKVKMPLLRVPVVFGSLSGRKDAMAPGAPLRRALDKEVRRLGSQALWWPEREPGLLQAARASARLPGEIAGRQVGIDEAAMVSYIDYLQGVPLLAPKPDATLHYRLTRLSRLRAPDGASSMKAHRITGYGLGEHVLVVGLKTWNALAPEIIDALKLAAEAAAAAHSKRLQADVEATLAEAGARGLAVEPMIPKVQAQWRLRAWELWYISLFAAKERGALLRRAAEWMRDQALTDIE